LAEIAEGVIILETVLSSMVDHIIFYLSGNGKYPAPEIIYLPNNNRYTKKGINSPKLAQRESDEVRKTNKTRILYLKPILREWCRAKGFL
jgi:hypothetical protein